MCCVKWCTNYFILSAVECCENSLCTSVKHAFCYLVYSVISTCTWKIFIEKCIIFVLSWSSPFGLCCALVDFNQLHPFCFSVMLENVRLFTIAVFYMCIAYIYKSGYHLTGLILQVM